MAEKSVEISPKSRPDPLLHGGCNLTGKLQSADGWSERVISAL